MGACFKRRAVSSLEVVRPGLFLVHAGITSDPSELRHYGRPCVGLTFPDPVGLHHSTKTWRSRSGVSQIRGEQVGLPSSRPESVLFWALVTLRDWQNLRPISGAVYENSAPVVGVHAPEAGSARMTMCQ